MLKKPLCTAIFILLATTTLSIKTNAQSSSIYVAGYMGMNLFNDQNYKDSATNSSGDIELDNGSSFAGALGLRLSKQARIEAEISYHSADLSTIDIKTIGAQNLGGSLKSWNGMMNVYYDFDVPWKVQPYIGGGVGVGLFEADINTVGNINLDYSDDTTALIWQAGAGVKYRTRSDVAFTLGYRYLDSTDLEFEDMEVDYGAHEIRVGLEYDLKY